MSDAPIPLEVFAALSEPEIIERYRRGTERIERRLLDLNDDQLDMFFTPDANAGRWSCRVLLGHLADAELSFVHRMRRTVAEEHPLLSAWDEDAFIDAGLYGKVDAAGKAIGPRLPVAGSVAVIHTLRAWHTDWLRTLAAEQWKRTALHPQRGEQSVRVIMNYTTWHLEHHVWFLGRKLTRLLGPAAA